MSDSEFSIQRQLDAICDEFEENWSANQASDIKGKLGRIEEAHRGRLLKMLIEIDIELRRKAGQTILPEDYEKLGNAATKIVADLISESTLPPSPSPENRNEDVATTKSLPDSPTAKAGRRIGPYKLLQQIGEGGMGSVWMADQEEPVKRRVALKVIKAGMDSKQVIARFEAERQALSMMDHPNIAKVLDAGMTEDGRPYFAMELVQGIPFTQYCDRNKLTPKERLELFVPVCQAIQHAHQKGIIHRDIKPSNVLVTLYDGKPIPKVIDFGLAKALQNELKLTDKTMFTEFGQVVGTLQYMSPEQAEMNALDVDTRTDVYSLGVMLYELLTGSTPLDRKSMIQMAQHKILEQIREKDPPRPSTRLSESGDAITGISQQRKIAPSKLQQILKGELDWIVMKALEKDRTRRYEGPGVLADDIKRFLNDSPVEARPPTFAYLLHKSFRKHKARYAAGLGFASLLLAGLLGTATMWLKAVDAESKATSSAAQAIAEAENARQAEARERDARHVAEAARESALEAKEKTEYTLARSNYFLAVARWEANRVDEAFDLLSRVPPKFRHIEWFLAQREWQGFDFAFQCNAATVDISPDGKWIVCGGDQAGRIEIWDALSGVRECVLTGQSASVNSVKFSPDGKLIASAGDDDSVRIWNAASGEQLSFLEGHKGNVTCVCFSHDGKRIASGSEDNTVILWDIQSGKQIGVFPAYGEDSDPRNPVSEMYDITNVVFSPDDSTLVANGADNPILVWDARSGERLRTLRSRNALDYSPDGRWIATGGGWKEGSITIWDANTGEQVRALAVKTSGVDAIRFSPDGARLAAARSDKIIEIWNVAAGKIEGTLKGSLSRVDCLAYYPNGSRLATGSADGVKVWDVSRLGPHRTMINFVSDWHFSFSPDGEMLACKNLDSDKLKVFDAYDGSELLSLDPGGLNIRDLRFDPASKRIVAAINNMIKVWNVETGDLSCIVEDVHVDGVSSARFSKNGAWIATVGLDYRLPLPGSSGQIQPAIPYVKFWNAETGRSIRSIKGMKGEEFRSLRISPLGNSLAVCTDDVVRVFDSETGNEQLALRHPGVRLFEFSPDGLSIASVSSANWGSLIKIWDVQTGLERCTLKGHLDSIVSLSFVPDGQRLASGGEDGTVRLWDTATGEELRSIRVKERLPAYPHVAFSKDGRRLVFGTETGLVEWNMRSSDELDPGAASIYLKSKATSDPYWHQAQGAIFFDEKQWFAAAFHYAWLVKLRPEFEFASDRFRASYDQIDSRIRALVPGTVKELVGNPD